MKISYKILLRRNKKGKITSAWQPDLRIKFAKFRDSAQANIVELITRQLQEYIAKQNDSNHTFINPEKFDTPHDYAGIEPKPNDIWTEIFVEVSPTKKFAEHFFPTLGTSSIIINALCVSLATFISIGLTLDTEDSTNDHGWSSSGAIFNLILTILIYYYSDTRDELKTFGKMCDNLLFCKQSNSSNDRNLVISDQHNNLVEIKKENFIYPEAKDLRQARIILNISKTVLLSLSATETFLSSVTTYQEAISLGLRIKNISPDLIKTWALLYGISNFIGQGTFNANFLNKGSNIVASFFQTKLVAYARDRFFNANEERPLLTTDAYYQSGITIRQK